MKPKPLTNIQENNALKPYMVSKSGGVFDDVRTELCESEKHRIGKDLTAELGSRTISAQRTFRISLLMLLASAEKAYLAPVRQLA